MEKEIFERSTGPPGSMDDDWEEKREPPYPRDKRAVSLDDDGQVVNGAGKILIFDGLVSLNERLRPGPTRSRDLDLTRLYLTEMSGHKLLTAREEVEIFSRIQHLEREILMTLGSFSYFEKRFMEVIEYALSGKSPFTPVVFFPKKEEENNAHHEDMKEREILFSEVKRVLGLLHYSGRRTPRARAYTLRRSKLVAEELIRLRFNRQLTCEMARRFGALAEKIQKENDRVARGKRSRRGRKAKKKPAKNSSLEKTKRERRLLLKDGGGPLADILAAAKVISPQLAEMQRLEKRVVECNLRLVVKIAMLRQYGGLEVLDLISEGNIGLIQAVLRFDFRRGHKFSTYATFWIRQTISRALSDKGRMIRIPVNKVDSIKRWFRLRRSYYAQHGREPTAREVAAEMKISVAKAQQFYEIYHDPLSLSMRIGDDNVLENIVEDKSIPAPDAEAVSTDLREQIHKALHTLPSREREVLSLRFGLNGQGEHTLDEVGRRFGVTRERARQIEVKALRKLRSPLYSKGLKAFHELE